MNRKIIATLIVVGAAAAAIVGLAATGNANDDPAPAASPVTANDPLYRFTMPAGWTKAGSTKDPIERMDTYTDGKGRYLRVHIFSDDVPFGSDYVADTTWTLASAAEGRGFTVAAKDAICEQAAGCAAGDGKLQVYALLRGTNDIFVEGHTFQFDYVDEHDEAADTQILEDMLESFRIK